MLIYIFKYSDGKIAERQFNSTKEADNFAHLEGDHLIEYKFIGYSKIKIC